VTLVDEITLDDELARANRLLRDRLGVTSSVLRGPYGYKEGWRYLSAANRRVILKNGFQWISGQFDDDVYEQSWDYWISAPGRDLPYAYPDGMVEIPVQGWTDRMWFDLRPEVDQAILEAWRQRYGHRPVPAGWRAPWTVGDALDDWITLNVQCLDYAYENRLLWVPVWHPYTHYLHDPDNRTLEELLRHAASKPERVWVCTVRDAATLLERQD
jgi:hypothetical protein